MYTLKKGQPAIEVADGRFAGRKYRHGELYDEVPEQEKHRFEQVADKTLAPPVAKEGRKKA